MILRQIPYGHSVNQVIDDILPDVWFNFRNQVYRQNALISAVGIARGGQDNTGGLLWLDYHNEFLLRQILANRFLDIAMFQNQPQPP